MIDLVLTSVVNVGNKSIPSKFSLDSKLKLSLLNFIYHLMALPGSKGYIVPFIPLLSWLIIPWLSEYYEVISTWVNSPTVMT